jgi:hypothetical protein
MDDIEREQRRARLRDPLTYTSVGEWFADYHGFVPIQMAHGLSQTMTARGLSFPDAYRLLRDGGAIIELQPASTAPEDPVE